MGVARPAVTAADSFENAGAGAMSGTIAGSVQDIDTAGISESSAVPLDTVQTGGGILEAIRSRPALKTKAEDEDQEGVVDGGKRQRTDDDDLSELDGDSFDDFNANFEYDNTEEYVREGAFEFLELPSEIRVMVYDCVCAEDLFTPDDSGRYNDHLRDAVAMISVSRQVREEALPVMFDDLVLMLDLDWHDKSSHCKSVYPEQKVDREYTTLYRGTLPKICNSDLIYTGGLRWVDETLSMLSYLKVFRVQLYDLETGSQAYFEVKLHHNNSAGVPTILVQIAEPAISGRYENAFKGLLTAAIGYWIDQHGKCHFSREFLDHLLEPAKVIQQTIQYGLELI